jgi:hypothetical protein
MLEADTKIHGVLLFPLKEYLILILVKDLGVIAWPLLSKARNAFI